jgi:NAD(P)H-dependent flavin oxidoreductase YrpB (nitropropane dioxygenase family)
MSDTPETDDLARGNHVVPTEWAQQLERERDEARIDAQKSKAYKRVLKETNLRQTERIRYLEGATNHACGTPLSVALRERDEAREALEFRRELYKVQEKCLEDARRERDEAREKAERYRFEANAMMMQRDEAREEVKRLKVILDLIKKDTI